MKKMKIVIILEKMRLYYEPMVNHVSISNYLLGINQVVNKVTEVLVTISIERTAIIV